MTKQSNSLKKEKLKEYLETNLKLVKQEKDVLKTKMKQLSLEINKVKKDISKTHQTEQSLKNNFSTDSSFYEYINFDKIRSQRTQLFLKLKNLRKDYKDVSWKLFIIPSKIEEFNNYLNTAFPYKKE